MMHLKTMRIQQNPNRPTKRPPHPSEQGYILVAVMFMLALLVIALAVAAPRIAKSIQRDREVETMHRGKQYARAVKLYYKKFGAYPPNVDALVKTNEIRFLRQKYTDPMTGKADWKPIALGQNKVPTAYGFFGVPLTGAGGAGSLCGNALPSATGGSSSGIGSGSSSFGSSGSSFGSSGSSSGSSSATSGCPAATSGSTSSSSTASTGSTDSSASSGAGATDTSGANGGSSSAAGGGTASGTTTGIGSGSNAGLSGQSFGGAGIMGFEPASPKAGILVYKKKNHYNEWEFVYDPVADQLLMQGGAAGGTGTGTGTNGLGGSGIGGSGIGGSGIGGSSLNPGTTSPTGGGTQGGSNSGTPPQ
jgi:type II secretory pathway pseudopilin PulG